MSSPLHSFMRGARVCILASCIVLAAPPCASAAEPTLDSARGKILSGDLAGALEQYNALLANEPDNAEAMLGKARVLSRMHDYESASALYRTVLARDPGNVQSICGLADISAWGKDYDGAIGLVEPLLRKNPRDAELAKRLARYQLWAQRKHGALRWADAALSVDPMDEDALDIRRRALAIRACEYFAGSYYLNMGDRGEGYNAYAGFRYRPHEGSLVYVQSDYLDRFDKQETRLLAGASMRVAHTWNIAAEIAASPDAEMYPIAAAWIELAKPLAKSLVLSGRCNYSAYREADLFGISLASEYYPRGDCALISRVAVSSVDFGGGTVSTDASALMKVMWFIDERARVFAYGSSGNESFMIETVDRIGDIRANAIGIGGTWFILPAMGFSPSFEYQERERGLRYLQFGLEACLKW